MRAYWLSALGIRFSGLGRPAEALPPTRRRSRYVRELAAASPDRYRPDLAASLYNLGVQVLRAGPPAEALPADAGGRGHLPGAGRRQPGPLPRPTSPAR